MVSVKLPIMMRYGTARSTTVILGDVFLGAGENSERRRSAEVARIRKVQDWSLQIPSPSSGHELVASESCTMSTHCDDISRT